MNETDYHRFADAALNALYDRLEAADAEGFVEVEYHDGILTIGLPSGKQYIISKHTVSREMWLSSPISGGLHFTFDGEWKLADGRTLVGTVMQELHAAGLEVAL